MNQLGGATLGELGLAELGIVRRHVDVNGIRTSYLEKGSGPTVLLVHGGDFSSPISAADFVPQVAALGDTFRVVAVDRLGQGFTDNPVGRYAYDMSSVCEHLADFVNLLGVDRYAAVGHSRGAMPAIALALSRPDQVAALVVVDSNTLTPAQGGSTRGFYAGARARRPADTDTDLARREPELNSYGAHHLTDDFVGTRVQVSQLERHQAAQAVMESPASLQAFLADVDELRAQVLASLSAGGLRAEVLVVWGREDPSAPLERGLELYRLLADSPHRSAELHVVNHAGHYSFRERADAVNAVLTGFLGPRLSPATEGN